MADVKMNLLKSLESDLKEDDGIGEVSIFTSKELDAPTDVLRAEIAEFGPDLISVLGEFFFIPFEEDELWYFSSVITLSASVPKEAAADVAAAVARLNYYLPCGCFALGDEDKNLVYRYTALINSGDDKKKQAADVITSANAAIAVAEKYMGHLLLVIKDEITVDEMVDMLTGKKE